jgi:hypothetical protein
VSITQPSPPAEPAPITTSTPAPARDVSVDVVRALCIVAVVVGHWLVVVPSYHDGHFDGINALGSVPLMRGLSWLFQVMPLFFVAGGVANLASWRIAQGRRQSYASWLQGRVQRLLQPTLGLVAVWVSIGVILRVVGVDAELVRTLAWLVVVPVWFLAVYLVVVALAPVMAAGHDRFRAAVLVGLGVGAVVVDGLRIGVGLGAAGVLNFFFVFLFCQQLGFWWFEGRLHRRTIGVACLVGGLTTLWLLTHVGPYPVSLVGVPGEVIANNAPPTITLIALGVAQAGAALLARGWLTRLASRGRVVASATVVLNRNAMTILLWHFTALVVAALVILPLGVVPEATVGSGAWWVERLLAVGVMAVLVAVAGRRERTRRSASSSPTAVPSTGRMVTAVGTGAAACSMITLGGLNNGSSTLLGVPALAMALLAASALLAHPRPGQVNEKIASKSSSCS